MAWMSAVSAARAYSLENITQQHCGRCQHRAARCHDRKSAGRIADGVAVHFRIAAAAPRLEIAATGGNTECRVTADAGFQLGTQPTGVQYAHSSSCATTQ